MTDLGPLGPLDELLAQKPGERGKWLKEKTDQEFTGQAAAAVKEAKTPEDAVAALEKKVAKSATPRIVPPGAMVLSVFLTTGTGASGEMRLDEPHQ